MRTKKHFLATELRHTKSMTLSISTMNFNMLHLLEHDPHDRLRLHEVRAESRNSGLVFLVSRHLSTPSAELSSSTKNWKDFELLQTCCTWEAESYGSFNAREALQVNQARKC